jgi:hypothetical protein
MRRLGRFVVLSGLLMSLACVATLHVVRTDLPPLAHRLSEYANGPFGWLMASSFVTLSCALAVLGALWARAGRNGWILPGIAVLASLGAVLSAVFETGGSAFSETIHSRASAFATIAIVVLALVYSMPIELPQRPVVFDPVDAALAVAAVVLVGISSLLHETRWTGLGQRALWLILIVWLVRATWRYPNVASSAPQSRGFFTLRQW